MHAGRRARGFTLFELAVCTAVAALLAGVLLTRLQSYHAQMERAAAMHVVAAARTALAARITLMAGQGGAASLEAVAQENPMTWLAYLPNNYEGEFDRPLPGAIRPGHWYFDRSDRSINFVQPRDTFTPSTSKLLKFKVKLLREPNPNRISARTVATQGLVLAQVTGGAASKHH